MAMVEARMLAQVDAKDASSDQIQNYGFLSCSRCGAPVVTERMAVVTSGEAAWSEPRRVWPEPEGQLSMELPAGVRQSLIEAMRCFRAEAYTACAVMCGKAIEAIGYTHSTRRRTLGPVLKELLERGVIDNRLYEWGTELQRHRNIAAHPSNRAIGREDARYLLDFAIAICDYVFILTRRFEEFQQALHD